WPRRTRRVYHVVVSTGPLFASELYAEWLLWHPELSVIWRELGKHLLHIARFADGRQVLGVAVNMDPHAESIFWLGSNDETAGRHDRAVSEFEAAIRAGKKTGGANPWHEYALARSLFAQGGIERAKRAIEILRSRESAVGGDVNYWSL